MARSNKIKDFYSIQTPQGKIHFPTSEVYSSIDMSGGFDSWVCFYLFLYSLNENGNFDHHVWPVHVVKINNSLKKKKYDRKDTTELIHYIVNYCRKKFPLLKNIHDPLISYVDFWWTQYPMYEPGKNKTKWNYTYSTNLRQLSYFVQQNFFEDIKHNINKFVNPERIYVNVNSNNLTPDSNGKLLGNNNEDLVRWRRNADDNTVTNDSLSIFTVRHAMPFRNANKALIYWLANKYGILEDVDKYAWSCESNALGNDNFTKPCNSCWQCKERNWGRENYKNL